MSYEFTDGANTGDSLKLTSNLGNADFFGTNGRTFVFWFKTATADGGHTGGDGSANMLSFTSTSQGDEYYYIGIGGDSFTPTAGPLFPESHSKPMSAIRNGGGSPLPFQWTSTQDDTTSEAITLDSWHMVTGRIFSNGNIDIRLDDGAVYTRNNTDRGWHPNVTTSSALVPGIETISNFALVLGERGDSSPGNEFAGHIAGLAYWDSLLTAQNISDLYNDVTDPETLNAYAYYPLKDDLVNLGTATLADLTLTGDVTNRSTDNPLVWGLTPATETLTDAGMTSSGDYTDVDEVYGVTATDAGIDFTGDNQTNTEDDGNTVFSVTVGDTGATLSSDNVVVASDDPAWVTGPKHISQLTIGGAIWLPQSALSHQRNIEQIAIDFPGSSIAIKGPAGAGGFRFDQLTFDSEFIPFRDPGGWGYNKTDSEGLNPTFQFDTIIQLEHLLGLVENVPNAKIMLHFEINDPLKPFDSSNNEEWYPHQTADYYAAYAQYLFGLADGNPANYASDPTITDMFEKDINDNYLTEPADGFVGGQQVYILTAAAQSYNWANLRARRGRVAPYSVNEIFLGQEPDHIEHWTKSGMSGYSGYAISAVKMLEAIRGRGITLPYGVANCAAKDAESADKFLGELRNSSIPTDKPAIFDQKHVYFTGFNDTGNTLFPYLPDQDKNQYFRRAPKWVNPSGHQYGWRDPSQWPGGVDYSSENWFHDETLAVLNHDTPDNWDNPNTPYGDAMAPGTYELTNNEHGIFIISGFKFLDQAGALGMSYWYHKALKEQYHTRDCVWVFESEGFSMAAYVHRHTNNPSGADPEFITRTPIWHMMNMVTQLKGLRLLEHSLDEYEVETPRPYASTNRGDDADWQETSPGSNLWTTSIDQRDVAPRFRDLGFTYHDGIRQTSVANVNSFVGEYAYYYDAPANLLYVKSTGNPGSTYLNMELWYTRYIDVPSMPITAMKDEVSGDIKLFVTNDDEFNTRNMNVGSVVVKEWQTIEVSDAALTTWQNGAGDPADTKIDVANDWDSNEELVGREYLDSTMIESRFTGGNLAIPPMTVSLITISGDPDATPSVFFTDSMTFSGEGVTATIDGDTSEVFPVVSTDNGMTLTADSVLVQTTGSIVPPTISANAEPGMVWAEGFRIADTEQELNFKYDSVTFPASTSVGTGALIAGSSRTQLMKTLDTMQDSTVGIRITADSQSEDTSLFRWEGSGTVTDLYLRTYLSGGDQVWDFRLVQDSAVVQQVLYSSGGTNTAYFQARMLPTSFELRVDLFTIMQHAGTLTDTTNLVIGMEAASGSTVSLSDLVVYHNTGIEAPFRAPMTVRELNPNANGAVTQWTVLGPSGAAAVGSGDYAQLVGINSTEAGQRDLWDHEESQQIGEVVGVQVNSVAQDTGGTVSRFQHLARPGVDAYAKTREHQTSTEPKNFATIFQTNPETGQPWTVDEINNAQFGVESR